MFRFLRRRSMRGMAETGPQVADTYTGGSGGSGGGDNVGPYRPPPTVVVMPTPQMPQVSVLPPSQQRFQVSPQALSPTFSVQQVQAPTVTVNRTPAISPSQFVMQSPRPPVTPIGQATAPQATGSPAFEGAQAARDSQAASRARQEKAERTRLSVSQEYVRQAARTISPPYAGPEAARLLNDAIRFVQDVTEIDKAIADQRYTTLEKKDGHYKAVAKYGDADTVAVGSKEAYGLAFGRTDALKQEQVLMMRNAIARSQKAYQVSGLQPPVAPSFNLIDYLK